MPRVVNDQKTKYETDELFKKLSQEMDVRVQCFIYLFLAYYDIIYGVIALSTQVKYTGARDKSIEERKERFLDELKQGHSVIVGLNL